VIYIYDLPACLKHSKPSLYADDTKSRQRVASYTDCIKLQEDLVNLCEWSNDWKLKFKPPKCAHLCFHISNPPIRFSYKIDGSEIDTL